MVEEIMEYLPVLIPLAIIQFGLMITALVHAVKHPKYKVGNLTVWVLVILLVNIIGPVLYFIIGRGEAAEDDYDKYS